MPKGAFAGLHPVLQLILLICLVLVSSLLVTLIGVLIAIPFWGLDPVVAVLNGGAPLYFMKYLQLVQSIAMFVVPPIIAAVLFSKSPASWLGFNKPVAKAVFFAMVTMIVIQPFVSLTSELNMQFSLPESMDRLMQWMQTTEEAANSLMFSFLDTTDPVVILYNIFLIAIVPAVGEELLFRGGIQNLLIRWLKNPHVAIIATAILFSAMHMQFLTFLPRFVLGLVLGYLMVYGRSIWYSIIGHFTNNFLSLVVFHYYRITKPDVNPLDPSQVGDSQPLLGWAGLVVVLALLYYFRQHVKARSEVQVAEV